MTSKHEKTILSILSRQGFYLMLGTMAINKTNAGQNAGAKGKEMCTHDDW